MRRLNKRQKDILKILYTKGVLDIENISKIYWDEIVKLNDYETLTQDANRFLGDLDTENF